MSGKRSDRTRATGPAAALALVLAAALIAAAGCAQRDLATCGALTCPTGTVCVPEVPICVAEGGVTASTATLDFGALDCGTNAVLPLVVSNPTGAPATVIASSSSLAFEVRPLTATIEPGAQVVFEVQPAAQRVPGPIRGEITISDSFEPIKVPVTLDTRGALLSVNDVALDFGERRLGTQVTRVLALRNDGNAPVVVTPSALTLPYQLDSTAPRQLDPGEDAQLEVTFAPIARIPSMASLDLSYTGALCGAAPTALPLRGVGTDSAVLASPVGLDFAPARCSEPEQSMAITIENTATGMGFASVAMSIEGPYAALFEVPANNVAVTNGTTDSIEIKRRETPAQMDVDGTIDATLRLAISQGNVVETKHISLKGAIEAPRFSLSSDRLQFDTKLNNPITYDLGLSNHGLIPGTIAWIPTIPGLLVLPQVSELGMEQDAAVRLYFSAQEAGDIEGTVRFQTDGACTGPTLELPFAVKVTP